MPEIVRVLLFIALGWSLMGGLFATLGLLRSRWVRGWRTTTGTVVTRSGATQGMRSQYPTFRWRDQYGIEHRRTSMVRQSFAPAVGATVPIRFDPNRPSRGVIDTAIQRGTVFVWIGGAMITVGAVVGVVAVAIAL